MARLDINIQSGGLNRQSASTDTWGGLFVEVDALPQDWTANEVKRIFRPEDLEPYGITEDSTNDNYRLAYWHVSEAFRLAPNGTLYVQLGVPASDGTTAATIVSAFNQAEDKLRLFAAVKSTTELSATEVEAFQSALDSIFVSEVQPIRCVVTFKKEATGLLPDFSADDNYRVMVDVANDLTAGGLAKSIFDGSLGMCGAAGTFLGQLLRLSVHQKPSWREYPVNGSGRWELLGDINGASVETKTTAEIEAYSTEGLNLVVRTRRATDAYISNARMAGDTSDDYAIITHGRVIDKAATLAYDSLITALDSPVYVDPTTGFMTAETVAQIEQRAYDAINNNMVIGKAGTNVELVVDPATGSLPIESVYVDPTQNVLQTEKVVVQIRLIPVGAAKFITVDIGLTLPQSS